MDQEVSEWISSFPEVIIPACQFEGHRCGRQAGYSIEIKTVQDLYHTRRVPCST